MNIFIFLVSFSNLLFDHLLVRGFCQSNYYISNSYSQSSIRYFQYASIIDKGSLVTLNDRLQCLILIGENFFNGFLDIIDLYTRKTVYSYDEKPRAFQVLSTGELVFLNSNGNKLFFLIKANVMPYANLRRIALGMIYVEYLNAFLLYYENDHLIYLENGEPYPFNDNDKSFIYGRYQGQTITFLVVDEDNKDLYIVIGKEVVVLDLIRQKIWFVFLSHKNPINNIKFLWSANPEKLCLISTEFDDYLGRPILLRWQPDYSQKYLDIIAQTTIFLNITLGISSITSISTFLNKENFEINGPSLTQSNTEIILMFSNDLSWSTSYNLGRNPNSKILSAGDIELTDVLFFLDTKFPLSLKQISLYSADPECSSCKAGLNLWFYPYLKGCAKSCDNYNMKNYPYCEPNCNSQTCYDRCLNGNCKACDSKNYITFSRGAIKVDCMPKLSCNIYNEFALSNYTCQTCHSSCKTCIGPSENQCLSCNSEKYFNVAGTNCVEKCNSNQAPYSLPDYLTHFCLDNTENFIQCPYGLYSKPSDLKSCQNSCDPSCESCVGIGTNCTSCSANLVLFNNTCVQRCPQSYYYGKSPKENELFVGICRSCSELKAIYGIYACMKFNCQIQDCNLCSSLGNQCSICNKDKFQYEGLCVKQCPESTFIDSQYYCKNCSIGCKICESLQKCNECQEGYIMNAYATCQECNTSLCKTCSNSPNNCTSCVSSDDYLDKTKGTCVKFCPSNYFLVNITAKICESCDSNCQLCEGSPQNCTKCSLSQYLQYNKENKTYKCVSNCPIIGFYSEFSTSSQTNYYCLPCIDNCLYCTNDTCMTCDYQYSYDKTSKKCIKCNESCATCSPLQPSKCTSCKDKNLFLDTQTGICSNVCQSNIYLSSHVCGQCDKNCDTCSISPNNCTSCNAKFYALYHNSTDKLYNCAEKCPSSTYNNTDQKPFRCLPCGNFCATCDDEKTCSKCFYGYYLSNGQCVSDCPQGFFYGEFPDKNQNCTKCDETCKECIYSATNCLSCEFPQLYYKNSCHSTCPFGTYALENQKECALCDQNICKTCENNFQNCTSCMNDSLTLVDNTCVLQCDAGFYEDQEQQKCLKCPENCFLCEDANSCSLCNENYILDDLFCVKNCRDGYFAESFIAISDDLPGKACKKCPELCSVCNSAEFCEICLEQAILNTQKLCGNSCQFHQFISETVLDNNKIKRVCEECSSLCETCAHSSNNCSSCSIGKFLYQIDSWTFTCVNSCFSSIGHFITIKDGNIYCEKCSLNCKYCDSATYCDLCQEGYRLNGSFYCELPCKSSEFILNLTSGGSNCLSECNLEEGHYIESIKSQKYCRNCSENCLICNNISHCSQCSNGFKLNSDFLCEKKCSEDFFYDDFEESCLPCEINCAKCEKKGYNCTECHPGSFLFINEDLTKKCLPCQFPCLECLNSPLNCTACLNPLILTNNTCKKKNCPSNCSQCFENQTCTLCNSGFSLHQGRCVINTCDINCFLCINDATCQECNENYKVFEGKCVRDCPRKTFVSKQTPVQCLPCSSDGSCAHCNSSNSCFLCENLYVLQENQCVSQCGEQFYWDESFQCKPCSSSCGSCYGNNSNNCLTCKEPFYLKGTVCLSPCAEEGKACSIEKQNLTFSLVKSLFQTNEFYLLFSQNIDIPSYVNLTSLFTVQLKDLTQEEFAYTVERVEGQDSKLLMRVNLKKTLVNPTVIVSFSPQSNLYIHDDFNRTFIVQNNTNNMTLEGVFYGKDNYEKKTEIKANKLISDNFIGFSSTALAFCVFCYFFNSQRMAFYWIFVDFCQLIAFLLFLKINLPENLIYFFQGLFFFHADFYIFWGKRLEIAENQVFYFSYEINSSPNHNSFEHSPFIKYLYTTNFIPNGLNAFLCIFFTNILFLVLKGYFHIHLKIFKAHSQAFLYSLFYYFYKEILLSLLIRLVQFFFYIIILSSLLQLSLMDFKTNASCYGSLFSIMALLYYLVFFIWLSGSIINSPDIYNDSQEKIRYDCIFQHLITKTFLQRNHFMILQCKKFFYIIFTVSALGNASTFLGLGITIQFFMVLKYFKYRPYDSYRMNFFGILTESSIFIIFCALLAIDKKTQNLKGGIASEDTLFEMKQASDAIIAFCFIVMICFFIASLLLALFYVVKNIDCLCAVCFGLRKDEEHEKMLESFERYEEQKKEQSSEESKFKIKKKKDLWEIAEEETKRQRDIEEFRREYIVKTG